MKTIIINGKDFCYNDEVLTHESIKPIDHQSGRVLLLKTRDLLKDVGLEFSLAFGTLLGAVRDKGIIKGDEDLDVFVDNEEKLYSSIPYFDKNGLHLMRFKSGTVYSFRTDDNAYIDIYILRPIKGSLWSLYCYNLCIWYMPKAYFKEYIEIEFLGETFRCPAKPERLLELWYGKTWRTPVRGHKFKYEVRSHYYWKHNIRPLIMELTLYPIWRAFLSSRFNSISESINDWKSYKASLK